jgi:hypothetical protein
LTLGVVQCVSRVYISAVIMQGLSGVKALLVVEGNAGAKRRKGGEA